MARIKLIPKYLNSLCHALWQILSCLWRFHKPSWKVYSTNEMRFNSQLSIFFHSVGKQEMCTGWSALCLWCGMIQRRKRALGLELKNLGNAPTLSCTCCIIQEVMGSGVRCLFELRQVTLIYLRISFTFKIVSVKGNYLIGSWLVINKIIHMKMLIGVPDIQ